MSIEMSLSRPLVRSIVSRRFAGSDLRSSPYYGLSGAHDYYVDDVNGDDGNDGMTPETAWASLNKIEALEADGGDLRVLVAAGTYDKIGDHIEFADITDSIMIAFEPGCTMDGTINGTTAQNPIYVDGGELIIYGNGLTIYNYNGTSGGSPNGLGYGGTATLRAYDVTVDTVNDGISGHAAGVAYLYDCTIRNGSKWCVANVDDSIMYAFRCRFEFAVFGVGSSIQSARGLQHFEDCVIVGSEAITNKIEGKNQVFIRCQLGDETNYVSPVADVNGLCSLTMTDCYINIDIEAEGGFSLTRCFGKMTARIRNTPNTFSVQDCVFVGIAKDASVLHINSDFGGACAVDFAGNIVEGSNFTSFTSAHSGYLVASGSSFADNQLYGGATWDSDLDPSLISGPITTDPLLATGSGLLMAGYVSAAGVAGFGSGDVAERAPMRELP